MRKEASSSSSVPGVAVDAHGGAVIDPTANVLQLTEAATQRQDDLREASNTLNAARIDSLERITNLRAQHNKELIDAETRRLNEQMLIRASYEDRLAIAEAKRIDAIRAVDVNAVAVASQRASDQANVLATQVAQSAEALRSLVASTAQTVAQSQQQLATTLSTRITTLEQGSYQAAGKSALSDPQMVELVGEMKALRLSQGAAQSASQTKEKMSAPLLAGIISIVVSIVVAIVVFLATRAMSGGSP